MHTKQEPETMKAEVIGEDGIKEKEREINTRVINQRHEAEEVGYCLPCNCG